MMIFDVNMDFSRKARLVARGDMTDTPPTLTYSNVVSRESVQIAFLLAALNDLELMMFDVGNAYLNAATSEKLYTTAGKEFGAEEEGKLMIIQRALYGLKSSGAAYRAHNEHKCCLKDVGPPLHYLGAQIGKYKFNDDKQAWYMSAQQYLQQAILEIESKWGALNKIFGN
jgi:Reverse transcriptase (RNA-dependent DNA polymerase)